MDEPHILAPAGELDIAAARELTTELNEAAGDASRPLIVDLSDVSLLDSTVLGAIVQAHHRLRRQGRPMAVVAPPGGAVAALFAVTRTGDLLPVYPSLDEALDAVSSRP